MITHTYIILMTFFVETMLFAAWVFNLAIEQRNEFERIMKYGINYNEPEVEENISFLKLLEKCYELDNKNKKDRDRYVPCIAYTDAHTFGASIKDSVKEYGKFKRAWIAIIYAKVMAVIHDRFLLKEKDYGIIYYVEEK